MTFDRYVFRQFAQTFVTCLTATLGLLIVIDAFENIDEFSAGKDGSWMQLVVTVVAYYGYQALFFIDRAGAIMILLAIVVVLITLQRGGELHPLLAAGVPMFRILRPLVIASCVVNTLLIVNQELVIPRIAHLAMAGRGNSSSQSQELESAVDHSTRIAIDGESILPAENAIVAPFFVLPSPNIVRELTILRAERAVFHPEKQGRPAGWLLVKPQIPPHGILLTDEGSKIVLKDPRNGDLFIVSPVNCDQLYRRGSSDGYLSTQELIQRIHCSAFGPVSIQRYISRVHQRTTQPLLNLFSVLITLPLMVRRESRGLVSDSAMCGAVLAFLFGLSQGGQFLVAGQVLSPDLAAWIPVVTAGGMAAWVAPMIRS